MNMTTNETLSLNNENCKRNIKIQNYGTQEITEVAMTTRAIQVGNFTWTRQHSAKQSTLITTAT